MRLSVRKAARQAGGAPSGSLCHCPPRPTTRHHHRHCGPPAPGATRREEERTERRDETGLLPLKEEGVRGGIGVFGRREGVGRLGEEMGRKREEGEKGGATPVLSGGVSVSESLSVLTLSKSICHRNCGTKREGSLPGRTHLEREMEKRQDSQNRKGLRTWGRE